MSSTKTQEPADPAAADSVDNKRHRLAWILFAGLAILVMLFNVGSIFLPGILGASAWRGTAISIGLVAAYGIVLLIVLAAVYYVHWTNTAIRKERRAAERDS